MGAHLVPDGEFVPGAGSCARVCTALDLKRHARSAAVRGARAACFELDPNCGVLELGPGEPIWLWSEEVEFKCNGRRIIHYPGAFNAFHASSLSGTRIRFDRCALEGLNLDAIDFVGSVGIEVVDSRLQFNPICTMVENGVVPSLNKWVQSQPNATVVLGPLVYDDESTAAATVTMSMDMYKDPHRLEFHNTTLYCSSYESAYMAMEQAEVLMIQEGAVVNYTGHAWHDRREVTTALSCVTPGLPQPGEMTEGVLSRAVVVGPTEAALLLIIATLAIVVAALACGLLKQQCRRRQSRIMLESPQTSLDNLRLNPMDSNATPTVPVSPEHNCSQPSCLVPSMSATDSASRLTLAPISVAARSFFHSEESPVGCEMVRVSLERSAQPPITTVQASQLSITFPGREMQVQELQVERHDAPSTPLSIIPHTSFTSGVGAAFPTETQEYSVMHGHDVVIKTVIIHCAHNKSWQWVAVLNSLAASRLEHDNIVPMLAHDLYLLGTDGGGQRAITTTGRRPPRLAGQPGTYKLTVVQEVLNGGNLLDALQARMFHRSIDPMTRWQTILHVLKGICRAMQYMHLRHVLHGRLSSETVALEFDERAFNDLSEALKCGQVKVKVGDCGLVQWPCMRECMTMEETQAACYWAPELDYTSSLWNCDVYAFGVIMWELLVGHSVAEKCSVQVQESSETMLSEFVRCATFPKATEYGPPKYMAVMRLCLNPRAEGRPSFTDIAHVLRGVEDSIVERSFLQATPRMLM